ncbi:MAG: rhomboid family intramembrane serine protease [Planctomycetota bacterium]
MLANLFVFCVPFVLGITPWRDWYQLYHPLAVEMGAVAGSELTLSEPWRWILANFLHAGAIHLACNMLSLWSVGRFLETFLGARRFLAIYVFAALGATITSSTLGGADRLALGASGAVLGVAWGVFVLLYRIRDHLPDGVARKGMIQLGILLTASLVILPIWFPVDNWGHIGGSLVGGIATALMPFGLVRSKVWAWSSGLLLAAFVLVGASLPAWFAVEVVQGGRSRPVEAAAVEPISLEVAVDTMWIREDEPQSVTWKQLGVPRASVRWISRRAAPMGSVADHEAMLAEQVRNGSIEEYTLIYKEDRFGEGVGGVIAAYAIDFPGDGAAAFFGGQPAHRSLRFYRFFTTPFGSAVAVYYGQDHEADRRYGLEFVESVRPIR